MIALDISKDYDKVLHAGLLHKPKSYGIKGCISSIIESFLQDKENVVRYTTCHQCRSTSGFGSWTHLVYGMQQGHLVPFQELEFMQMILLHIPAYKQLL